MWHRESVTLFLEDQNTDPAELAAAGKRIDLVADARGMIVGEQGLEFALGDAELATKYDRLCGTNPSRYGNVVFVDPSMTEQERPILSALDALGTH